MTIFQLYNVVEAWWWNCGMFAVGDLPSIRTNCSPTAPLSLYQVGRHRVIITIIVSLYFSFTNYTFIISRFSNCSCWPLALSPPMMDGWKAAAGRQEQEPASYLQNIHLHKFIRSKKVTNGVTPLTFRDLHHTSRWLQNIKRAIQVYIYQV